ncbi:HNH endonuclease [Arenimonas oryziterrae]|uniref:HNH endonuclease n=1 Tax=Arenimonas oryziterrae TaxID=498055 RepID=UPI0009DBB7E2|nr:HNH endonuclease [Arenimonas oryziterrae]
MTNAVFTMSESSAYDDQPELRYHFPKTYLRQVQLALGDGIVYYEPRRDDGPSSSGGRQAYFATAFVDRIEPDERRAEHFYAYLKNYTEFDCAVPFREGDIYREALLRKDDGSTNKGAFGRSVRQLPRNEFEAIVQLGLSHQAEPWELTSGVNEDVVPEYVTRPIVERLVSRKFRDEVFRRHVRAAYDNSCAVTGLRLINGGGRPEVQAAHIRPVEADGPDTVRNGLALTGTIHWLFDRGLLSLDDQCRVMLSPQGLPDDLDRLIPSNRMLRLPAAPELRPHPTYLSWHREFRFKR